MLEKVARVTLNVWRLTRAEPATKNKVQIRWLIRRDMPEVLEIENECFEIPWNEQDFSSCLEQSRYIGMVAVNDRRKIFGFIIYELQKAKLRIVNFAVAPAERRRGIGRQMSQRLVEKLSQQKRNEIVMEVRESNLDAQMFFKEQGFRAVRILHNHYDDTTEDAYVMLYRLEADDVSLPLEPGNRITQSERN